MQRYTSPTGHMEINPVGGFVTHADHVEAMERVPLSFAAHMDRHDVYSERANTIVQIYGEENAIEKSLVFQDFRQRVKQTGKADSIKVGLARKVQVNLSSYDYVEVEFELPIYLFDETTCDNVIVEARKYKAEQERILDIAQQAKRAAKEQQERRMLRELVMLYPDELKEEK